MEVQFWSEQAATKLKLEQYRTQFKTRLDSAVAAHGIEQLDIGVFDGAPPPAKQNISSQLIDATA